MKVQKYFYLAAIFVLSNNLLLSQSNHQQEKLDLKDKILNHNSSYDSHKKLNNKINFSKELTNANKKSPFLGALFSGIIPGTGEIYARNYLKGVIFLVVEAGLWTFYAINQNKGDDQTAKFQSFADGNWSINKYAQWIIEQQFTGYTWISDPTNPNREQLRSEINRVAYENNFHKLPSFGDQQYYEVIGKYQSFVPGWADADLNFVNRSNYGTYKTAMFTNYSYERQEANVYYDKASISLSIVILNHILSAADAAWSVSIFNKDLRIKTGMQMKNYYSHYGKKS